jgi:hypothetical protein
MKKLFTFLLLNSFTGILFAQLPDFRGRLNGGFETYTQFYIPDKAINSILPQDRVGSNNYLKLDYNDGPFSAGLQFEGYLPSVAGYPFNINQSKIINRYFKYAPKDFSIQVGDIYDQFGSGLIFRSWENRQIGINNAIEGVKITVTPVPFINLKALYGSQRKVFDHANSVVRGIDGDIDFTKINESYTGDTKVTAGGSYVTRYQQYTGPNANINPTVKAYSGRFGINGSAASLDVEYVQKESDSISSNPTKNYTGRSLLINGTYAKNNLGINLTLRSIKNFDFSGERGATAGATGISNVPVNYIPALTRQHDYLTTNIYVYAAQSLGETGGQLDIFYNLKNENDHPSRLSLNLSHYGSLDNNASLLSIGKQAFYNDANIQWRKTWSEKFITDISYYNIFYNKTVVEGGIYPNIDANIVVLTALHKYSHTNSVRYELQNLFTKQDEGGWFAALTEFGFAPKYTFFLSDLYNYGVTKIHYPNVGGSFSKGGSRFSIGYGRQRAGLFCVGGVCRYVPAATGVTLTLTTTFNK